VQGAARTHAKIQLCSECCGTCRRACARRERSPAPGRQEAAQAAPSAAEVATAQEEALNSFVFNFASTGAQLQRSLAYALLGLPQARPPPLTLSLTCRRPIPAACARLHTARAVLRLESAPARF
jgi:hypothetical protein